MFGNNAVKLSIFLNAERYVPGDKIVGTLVVDTPSPLSMESISVAIEGKATTRANFTEESPRQSDRLGDSPPSSSSTRTACESITFMRKSVQVFPPPYYAQGLSQSCLTIQQGTHTYQFELRLPLTCENSEDIHWSLLPLPVSCKFPYNRGDIQYTALATVHKRKGGLGTLFSSSPQGKKEFEIVTFSLIQEDPKQVFARRALKVPIFQQSGSWPSMVKRALGLAEPVFEQKMTAEMRLPSQGIRICSPTSPARLLDYLKLTLTRHDSGPAPSDKPTLFVVKYLEVKFVANYRVQAKHAVQTFEQPLQVYKSSGLDWPLVFQDDNTVDLSELLSDVQLTQPSTVAMTLPTMQLAYKFCIDLGVAPTTGHPLVSMHASLEVDLPITPEQAPASPPAYSESPSIPPGPVSPNPPRQEGTKVKT